MVLHRWMLCTAVVPRIFGHRESGDADRLVVFANNATSNPEETFSKTSREARLQFGEHGHSAWIQINQSSQERALSRKLQEALEDLKESLLADTTIWGKSDKVKQPYVEKVLESQFRARWWLNKIADFVPGEYLECLTEPTNVLKDVMQKPLLANLMNMSYPQFSESLRVGSVVSRLIYPVECAFALLRTRVKAYDCARELKNAESFQELTSTLYEGRHPLLREPIKMPDFFCNKNLAPNEIEKAYMAECDTLELFFQGISSTIPLRHAVCNDPKPLAKDIESVKKNLVSRNALGEGLTKELYDIEHCWDSLQALSKSLSGVADTLKKSSSTFEKVKESLDTVDAASGSKAGKKSKGLKLDVQLAEKLLSLSGNLIVDNSPRVGRPLASHEVASKFQQALEAELRKTPAIPQLRRNSAESVHIREDVDLPDPVDCKEDEHHKDECNCYSGEAEEPEQCGDHEVECKKVEGFFKCVPREEEESSMGSVHSAASKQHVSLHEQEEDVGDLPDPVKCKEGDQCNCLDELNAPFDECDSEKDKCEPNGEGLFKCVEDAEDVELPDCKEDDHHEDACNCYRVEDEVKELLKCEDHEKECKKVEGFFQCIESG